jgi:DNA-binding beta-propeller fold protein YncE
MDEPGAHELTELLLAWGDGDEEALARIAPLVHAELYRLAKRYMSRERPDHLLQTSALINEAYVRLIDLISHHVTNKATELSKTYHRYLKFLLVLLLGALCATSSRSQTKPDKDYWLYVLSESADKIALVRFGPEGFRVERQIDTGDMPVDIDGPHGIVISPDRQFYYVSIAHGRPFGTVWKYSTKNDAVLGKATLGYFPATLDISRDGNFLFVVNFNLHGDMVPSTVSVVSTQTMTEVARIPTCTMPHGSRLNPQGTKQYSACMMNDILVEIDTRTFKVTRQFVVSKDQSTHSTHGMPGHGSEPPKPGDNSCSPTWAEPSADGSSVYVACNGSSEIVEVNANAWTLARRIPARPGVYNLEVTHDGQRLIATNKRDQSVSIYDLKTGRELVRLPTKRKVLHGVVVSPDDRYAFVTVEGIGSEPGTVEVIDLTVLKTVATLDIPPGAAGIAFYK